MDMIDKRNMRDKIARSVIKGYNVHYVTQEELDRQKAEEEAKRAREICDRLQAEADADENAKQEEIREAMRRQEGYNAKTKSYSGDYGKEKPTDEVTLSQIEQILNARENEFMKTLQESLDQM